jgi:polyhydroxyalkanoate synthesis regulator phasin
MSKDDDSFTEGKLFQPQAHLAKQNENALSMTAPKGQEHTEHDLETVVAAVETILTKYELSHDETNDYVESIMRVVWCQKEGDYERKQYVSTLQRDLAAANARADAAERKLASLTNQTAGARYLINAFDENSLSPVEVIEVMRKVFK